MYVDDNFFFSYFIYKENAYYNLTPIALCFSLLKITLLSLKLQFLQCLFLN